MQSQPAVAAENCDPLGELVERFALNVDQLLETALEIQSFTHIMKQIRHAAVAVEATRSLVLTYQSRPFAPMYTRSCSGQTRTPAQVGLPAAAYPYFSVECDHCRRHPIRWTSYIPAHQAGWLRAYDESARLALARQFGWSVIPSNDFSFAKDGDRVLLKGVGNGHGIGLCQAGARAMAESGAGFREILLHYYPNTDIARHSGPNRPE